MEKLAKIIQELKAPKNQKNSFGGYNYRSCEDILEAVKPLLNGAILTISDDLVMLGDRFYVKATATFRDGDFIQTATGWAREEVAKKGMDASQLTGATSSYARKYALNGLFCIDDTKDADATNTHGKENKSEPKTQPKQQPAKPKVDPVKAYMQLVADKGITGADADAMISKFEKEMTPEQQRAEYKRLKEWM